MSKKLILQLCADTGSDTKPYQDHPDYEVRLIGSEIGVENYSPPNNVYGIIANPVCTEFSCATGFNNVGDHAKGLFLVEQCQRIIAEANPVFWAIENPASGRLKHYLGEPDLTYEPWHYGSPWTKKTALWGKFNKPKRIYTQWDDVPKLDGLYTRPNRPKPSLAFMHKYAVQIIGRKADQYIQPYMFGHAESKSTGLWLKNLPLLTETNNVKEVWKKLPKSQAQRLHMLPPSPDRWKIRSETYQGIAEAIADQLGGYALDQFNLRKVA